jgi:hypothetical protein
MPGRQRLMQSRQSFTMGGRPIGVAARAIDATAYARVLVALMQGLHVLARVETEPQRLHDTADAALAPLAAAATDDR